MNCPNPHCYNGVLLNAIGEVAGICPTCAGFSCFKECADRDATNVRTLRTEREREARAAAAPDAVDAPQTREKEPT